MKLLLITALLTWSAIAGCTPYSGQSYPNSYPAHGHSRGSDPYAYPDDYQYRRNGHSDHSHY
jgi:hypothetical protein